MPRFTTAEKHFWVIAYDITHNRKRTKVAEYLEDYGIRRNFSVFEILVTPGDLNKIKVKLKKMVDPETDTILYYHLCRSCFDKKMVEGKTPDPVAENVVVV